MIQVNRWLWVVQNRQKPSRMEIFEGGLRSVLGFVRSESERWGARERGKERGRERVCTKYRETIL